MPELPEVETTRRGIEPFLKQQVIIDVVIRNSQLRWPVPSNLSQILPGQSIFKVRRRGKYLLLDCTQGTLLIHLGMSGSLRLVLPNTPVKKHEHIDIILANGQMLRYTDPRRFGCVLWTIEPPLLHPLLNNLGPEPLLTPFTANYLYQLSRKRTVNIKTFIMDAKVVVGVGNIYANEALFQAGIHPERAVNQVTLAEYEILTTAIKKILKAAVKQGGTTLRNFIGGDGKPGYFKQELQVYGHAGKACRKCQTSLSEIRLGQRSTVYCAKCQI